MAFNHLELKAQITRAGADFGDAAELLGVHRNTISNWVNGRAEPRPAQLLRLLTVLGIDVSQVRILDYWSLNGTGIEQ